MSKTILIVEDEYLIALDLQDILEGHGWQVFGPAANVKEALELLRAALPLVALLDVNLRDEIVTPVAEALASQDIPFILASAHDQPERFGGQILAGRPNVGKPVAERRLLTALNKLTGQ